MDPAIRTVCVFCGSQMGAKTAYADAARELGAALAARDLNVVYGGGSIGLMGTLAGAALEAGGRVIGVIPRKLARREVMHEALSEIHVVSSMHERKAMMSELSDAFVALPGGFGTLEEILEVITWGQLGIQKKPIGFLNVEGYFDHLIAMVDLAVAEGFIFTRYRDLFISESRIEPLLARLAEFAPLPPITEELGLGDV